MNQSFGDSEKNFSNNYLLIPRREKLQIKDNENVTFSKLVTERGCKNKLKDVSEEYINNFEDSARRVFAELDIIDVDNVTGIKQQDIKNSNGQFTSLLDIGMIAARFKNEEEAKRAEDKLSEQYKFIPDLPMSLPDVEQSEDKTVIQKDAVLRDFIWPEISGIPEAHKMGIKGKIKGTDKGFLIGVLDSGIDSDHEEFASTKHVKYAYVPLSTPSGQHDFPDVRGFDPVGHGTQVCGVLCGQNYGIVPEADLYVASVVGSENELTSLKRVLLGCRWLLKQFSTPENRSFPAIVNISLRFPPSLQQNPVSKAYIDDIRRSIQDLMMPANVLPIVSIGNSGEGNVSYPGAFKEVLGVGAVNFDLKVLEDSGSIDLQPGGQDPPKPDIVGYGLGVYSASKRNSKGISKYKEFRGTSCASPYVAGIAALYWSQEPELPVEEIKAKIIENVVELDKPPYNQRKERFGSGLAKFSRSQRS